MGFCSFLSPSLLEEHLKYTQQLRMISKRDKCARHVAIFEIGEKQNHLWFPHVDFECPKENTACANGRWWILVLKHFEKSETKVA